MRPRYKILDKTFNFRAKDRTSLIKAQKTKSRVHVPSSGKVYEFKTAPVEEPTYDEYDESMDQWTHGDTTPTTIRPHIYTTTAWSSTGDSTPSTITIGATW
jgi:hypothetical protein